MSLLLKYRAQTNIPVEVEGLTPTAVRDMSLAEIEQFTIFHGNQRLPLGEFFAVSGDASDGRLEFEGNLAGVHWIGAKMSEGEIRVAGPAGRHVGSEMSGGEIHVAGDAGDWLGAEIHGGLIHVRGRAGASCRRCLSRQPARHDPRHRFSSSAMRATRSVVRCAADLIAVGGSIGDFPAVNMIAGSLFVFGACGARPAAGMRRGTLASVRRPAGGATADVSLGRTVSARFYADVSAITPQAWLRRARGALRRRLSLVSRRFDRTRKRRNPHAHRVVVAKRPPLVH